MTTRADDTQDERIAFGERFHFGVHRLVSWPATLT